MTFTDMIRRRLRKQGSMDKKSPPSSEDGSVPGYLLSQASAGNLGKGKLKLRFGLVAWLSTGLLALASCVSSEPAETEATEAETQPFIDPVTLSQSMCSGRTTQASATALETAASLNPGFDYGKPFRLPGEVTDHFHYPISTASREAQLWFDHGLAHMANFNHDEAIASFRKAQASDPNCAMCFWGEGLSFGSNINIPYDANRGAAGLVATGKALSLLDGANEREVKLIKALGTRYDVEDEAVAENAGAFAEAMDSVAMAFPEDKLILSLAAEANMDTQPWDYWEIGAREPKGRTARTLELIEMALAIDPDYAPAIHLYIHITESSVDPYRAEAYADRLLAQDMGIGHLVHMPSHIYLRLGKWKKSHESNIAAIAADEAYIAATDNAAVYGSVYYPHNVHFVVASSQFAGNAATALEMADKLEKLAQIDPSAANPLGEHIAASPIFTDLIFSTDETVLAIPEPAAAHLYMRTAWHYARGTVLARQGDMVGAQSEMDKLKALTGEAGFADYDALYLTPLAGVHEVAALTLEGRMLAASGDLTGAIDRLEFAAAAEAQLPYFEPTWWYYPTRQTLGLYLLQDGQFDRAEREFFKTLIKAPNNAYALFGLAETYRAKGDDRSEAYARELFDEAWMGTEGTIPQLSDL